MKANQRLSRNVRRLAVSPYNPEPFYERELRISTKKVPYFAPHTQNVQNSKSVRRNGPTEGRATRTVLANNTQIFNSLIKALGGPAIERDQQGYFRQRPWSWKILVSFVLFSIIAALSVFAACQRVLQIIETNQFSGVVNEITSLVLLLPYIMSPLILWKESSKRIAFINRYIDVVMNFTEVTGHVPVQRNFGVLIFWIVFLFINTSLAILVYCLYPHIAIWEIIPYFFNISLISLMVSTWTLTCEYLRFLGVRIAQNFKEKYSTNPSAQTIRDFRTLWLELSSLCNDVGNAHCLMVGFIILMSIVVISLMLFGVLQYFPSLSSATLGIGLLYIFFVLLSIYNQPHRVTDQVPRAMRDVLEVIRVSAVSREEYFEIKSFVDVLTTNSPTVSLGGFADLNRGSFRTIVSTLITYLVVLLQLSLSSKTKPK